MRNWGILIVTGAFLACLEFDVQPAQAEPNPVHGAPEQLLLDRMMITRSLLNPVTAPSIRQTHPSLQKISNAELPKLLPDFDPAALKLAVERSRDRCEKMPVQTYTLPDRRVTRDEWCTQTMRHVLGLLTLNLSREDFTARLQKDLDWYQSKGRDQKGEVLYTGYYLPMLPVKKVPDAEYKYPLYRKPSDLELVTEAGKKVWRRRMPDGTLTTYFDRRAIDEGKALEGQGLEIAYTNDPFEIFITQIQGSGRLKYVDVDPPVYSSMNYAAQNGNAYTSIGAYLRDVLCVDPSYLSLQGMRRYFRENPDNLWPVMFHNPSYVFFSEQKDGPFGALGTQLVPGYSIAVDNTLFPLGFLSWVKAFKPKTIEGDQATVWEPFSRIMVSQDTGGAIRGAGRVDFYWGSGEYEEIAAGQLNHPGELFFAVLKPPIKTKRRK